MALRTIRIGDSVTRGTVARLRASVRFISGLTLENFLAIFNRVRGMESILAYGDEVDRKCFEHQQKIRAYRGGWPPPDKRPRVWLPRPAETPVTNGGDLPLAESSSRIGFADWKGEAVSLPYLGKIGGMISGKRGSFRLVLEMEDGSKTEVVDRSGLGLFRSLSEGDIVVFRAAAIEVIGDSHRFRVEQCPVRIIRNHGLRTLLLWGRIRQRLDESVTEGMRIDAPIDSITDVIAEIIGLGIFEIDDAVRSPTGCNTCKSGATEPVYNCRGYRNFEDLVAEKNQYRFQLCIMCFVRFMRGRRR